MNHHFLKKTHFQQRLYSHKGILNSLGFENEVDLRCYEPSPEMAAYVDVYFVARWKRAGQSYIAADILTKPVVNLFFTSRGAFMQGPVTGVRRFKVNQSGVYAGVKFKPGAFYAFSPRSYVNETVSLESIFQEATPAFNDELLELAEDDEILERIDLLLRRRSPRAYSKLELITKAIAAIDVNPDYSIRLLAQKCGVSERTLQQVFQRHVGVGIKWAMMRLRLLRAMEHSLRGKPNWTIVAAELNYSTQSHFINDFRRYIGVSPSHYVKLIQSNTLEPLAQQNDSLTVIL
jgi:AraC-like DNA-binding protein